jgi:chromosome segregation ATPase
LSPKYSSLPTEDIGDHTIMDGYRRLGGKNGFLASRNTSYFAILVVLIVFFVLSYLYYGASNEAAILKQELDSQMEHISKIKNEILESNVNLEKSRTSENACQSAKTIVDTKFDECSTERDKLKAKISDIESSVSEKEESIKSLKKDLAEKADALETDEAKNAAMEQAGVGQEAIIIKLNETLELMKKDLALKDNIIHDLKSKLGMNITENLSHEHAQPQANLTTPTESNKSENNVLDQLKRPEEPAHLSAKDFTTETKPPPPEEEPEPVVAEPGKPEVSQEIQEQKEIRNENGEFLGVREPGMRLKMEEAQKNEDTKIDNLNNAHLIDAAKNDENAAEA